MDEPVKLGLNPAFLRDIAAVAAMQGLIAGGLFQNTFLGLNGKDEDCWADARSMMADQAVKLADALLTRLQK